MMWSEAFKRALVSGSFASVLSSLALAACGKAEGGTAAGPNNGPSQWVWGERAAYQRRVSLRHTVVGYAIHHAMSIGWATVHEKHFASPLRGKPVAYHLAASAVTAACACFTDYQLAPRRLQPGFDKQLGRTSLGVVYAAFALGLASREIVATARFLRPRRSFREMEMETGHGTYAAATPGQGSSSTACTGGGRRG